MNNLKDVHLLDVTLRDGGYRNNFGFDLDYILDHARLMEEAGIDFIEIGYRNGSIVSNDRMGLTAFTANDYIRTLSRALPNIKLAVIVHAANITDQDVIDMVDNGVALIRFCANEKTAAETTRLARIAKERGASTTINLTRVSSIGREQLQGLVREINDGGAFDVLYCADSNGSLTPDQVTDIYGCINRQKRSFELGFHAHDNLGQAMANSIAAIKSGVTFIDASLLGMGKGIGNLRLEKWIAYLSKCDGCKYSLMSVLNAVERLRHSSGYVANEDDYNVDIISGLKNLSFVERDQALDLWQAAKLQWAV